MKSDEELRRDVLQPAGERSHDEQVPDAAQEEQRATPAGPGDVELGPVRRPYGDAVPELVRPVGGHRLGGRDGRVDRGQPEGEHSQHGEDRCALREVTQLAPPHNLTLPGRHHSSGAIVQLARTLSRYASHAWVNALKLVPRTCWKPRSTSVWSWK